MKPEMSNLYYVLMNYDEITILIDALTMCVDYLECKILDAEADPSFSDQLYCELCDKQDYIQELLSKIKFIFEEENYE